MVLQDHRNQGYIGVQELEEPLISVGLASTRDDVINLVAAASHDGSGGEHAWLCLATIEG